MATNRVRSGELGVLGECRCHSVLFLSVCDLHLASKQLNSVHFIGIRVHELGIETTSN